MMQQPLVGKGLLIIMITLRQITVGRAPLDKWSARPRDLSLYNTQQSQDTNIHATGGIRTRSLSKPAGRRHAP